MENTTKEKKAHPWRRSNGDKYFKSPASSVNQIIDLMRKNIHIDDAIDELAFKYGWALETKKLYKRQVIEKIRNMGGSL